MGFACEHLTPIGLSSAVEIQSRHECGDGVAVCLSHQHDLLTRHTSIKTKSLTHGRWSLIVDARIGRGRDPVNPVPGVSHDWSGTVRWVLSVLNGVCVALCCLFSTDMRWNHHECSHHSCMALMLSSISLSSIGLGLGFISAIEPWIWARVVSSKWLWKDYQTISLFSSSPDTPYTW